MARKETVAVIGAGAVGCAAAFQLARRGWHVRLIDPAPPGSRTTAASAAILAVSHVTPLAMPGVPWRVPGMLASRTGPLSLRWRDLPGLAPWFARFAGAAKPRTAEASCTALAALMADARPAWERLLERLDRPGDLVQRGWLTVGRTREPSPAAAAELDHKRAHGVTAADLDGAAVREACPAVDPAVAHGIDFPACAHLPAPEASVRAVAEAAGDAAGITAARVHRIAADATGVRLTTDAGEIAADRAVVAAGPWSAPLASAVGARVPLAAERGYWVTLPAPGVTLDRPLLDADNAITATPLADGVRLAGKAEFAALTAPPTPRHARAVTAAGTRLLPGLTTDGMRWGMGARPSTPDSRPVIGTAPAGERVILAFGHGHIGLTAAARTGEIVAALADGADPGLDLAPFAPDRFRA